MVYSLFIKLGDGDRIVPAENQGVPSEIIQVEVLNGCGIEGTADRFTDFLRNQNFDVVKTDNYLRFDVEETLVIDRIGNLANALKTGEVLGIERKNILQQINEDYFLDVSVIIGRDYYKLKPLN
jgi:hypothetical protein